VVPLLSIIEDAAVRQAIRRAAGSLEQQLRVERSSGPEALLLDVLVHSFATTDADFVSLTEVTRLLVERFGTEFERPITNRYVGSLLRNKLHLASYKRHGTYVIPLTERNKLMLLCERYGVTAKTAPEGE
jgi:hypothetical protein